MALPELQDTSGRLTDCIYFGDPISSSVGSGFVATTRTIGTTLPLTGGGDLSANRTLAINDFAGSVSGAVPPSTGGVVTFLRADGAWATPPTFGAAAAGYAPASGGGSTNYLRADGTWAAPAGTGITGLTTGRFPVATGATSIGNSRAIQNGATFEFRTAEADPVTDYESFLITEPIGGILLRPSFVAASSPANAYLTLASGNGTAQVTLDGDAIRCDGALEIVESAITLANGANTDISLGSAYTSFWRITGPTASFSVGGFTNPTAGRVLILYNTTDQYMTIVNEDLSASAANRILTLADANVILPNTGASVTFIYSGTDSRWILSAASSSGTTSGLTNGYVPYTNSGGGLSNSTLYHDVYTTRLGLGTTTPKATFDVSGTFALRGSTQALSAGLNSDIPAPATSHLRVSAGGAFSVGGFVALSGENGKRITLFNTSTYAMTIVNEDLSSTAANRIDTLTGANVVFPAHASVAHLMYDSSRARWVLEDQVGAISVPGSSGQIAYNLAGSLSSDSGLTYTGTGTTGFISIGTNLQLYRVAQRHLSIGQPNNSPSVGGVVYVTGTRARGGTDSNTIGNDAYFGGGSGTGTGGGGNTGLITYYPGGPGNTQNSAADRLKIAARPIYLTNTVGSTVATVSIGSLQGAAGEIMYSVFATDGADQQMRTGSMKWASVDHGGGSLISTDEVPVEVASVSSGTLAVTIASSDGGGGNLIFTLTATSSLTPTPGTGLYAWITMRHDGKSLVVIP